MNKKLLLLTAPLCLTMTSCKQLSLTGEAKFTADQVHLVYSHKEGYTSTLTQNDNVTTENPYLSTVDVKKGSDDAVMFYFFDTHEAAEKYGEKIQISFADWISKLINGEGVEFTVTYNEMTMVLKDFSILDDLKKLQENADKIPEEIPPLPDEIPSDIPELPIA